MDDVGDGSPDEELLILPDQNGGIVRVFRLKGNLIAALTQSFHGELPVDHRHDDLAINRGDRAVDNQDVPVVDVDILHGAALRPNEEGGHRVADKLLVEVNRPLDVIVRRGGKAGLDPGRDHGDLQWEALLEGDGGGDGHAQG